MPGPELTPELTPKAPKVTPSVTPEVVPDLTMIGWRERVDLPEWGVRGIRAKIDTGARTSAIDVAQIEELGGDRVRFEVVIHTRPERVTRWIEADAVRVSVVKPSSGQRQERIVCRTMMEIAGHEHEIDLSLVCRKGMLCRMLVGRLALSGVFCVDPARSFIVTKRKQRSRKRESNR